MIYTPHAYFGLGREGPATLFFNALERLLGRAGRTINVSFDERVFARDRLGLLPRQLVLIDNGVDLERFCPASAAEREKWRDDFSLPPGATVFAAVGRDSFQKNYRPLYRAMDRILADPAHEAWFVHAGAGAEELGATLSAESRKRFRAYAHVGEIERLLGAADAFVLTSRYEGLALSALQALACGLKVFLTRVTGNSALGRIGFDGISWIEFSGDEAEMAARIEAGLLAWLREKKPPGAKQVDLAQRQISAGIQFEKIWRLYGRVLRD